MPLLFIAGLAALVLGVIFFFTWFAYIVALLKATLPMVFIAGGAVAAYLGWEEMRDRQAPNIDFSSPDEASRYQAEAKVYQAEINEIKIETTAESRDLGTGNPGTGNPGTENPESEPDAGGNK